MPVRSRMGRRLVRSKIKLAALTLMLCVSACASTNGPTPSDPCNWVRPITWSDKDTDGTQREIFAHNLKYEQFCATK